MDRPKVHLRDQRRYNREEIAGHAADIIAKSGLDLSGKTVLVKPSFVYPSKSETVKGVITQPLFVAGVVEAVHHAGAKSILVGESSVIGPSRVSFESVGILQHIRSLARPVYLDEQETVEKEVENPLVQGRFRVPRIWLEADAYISLPKIKTNIFSGLTLSIKNNLGMLRQRDRLLYHDFRLHRKLVDLYKVRPPDLVLADCVVAGEGQGPLMADPVELGLVMGGRNAIAADVVACRLAGYDPSEIEHLKLLIQAGYGPASIEDIEIDEPGLLERARPFRRPETSLLNLSPRIRVFQGSEHYCQWGCAGLVRGAVDSYIARDGKEGIQRMNVILGKPIESVPDDLDPDITLVLGDCARPYRKRGAFVPGCCPRPLDVGMVIRRVMGPMEVEITINDVMKAYGGHNLWRMARLISGRRAPATENHIGLARVLREFFYMRRLGKRRSAKT